MSFFFFFKLIVSRSSSISYLELEVTCRIIHSSFFKNLFGLDYLQHYLLLTLFTILILNVEPLELDTSFHVTTEWFFTSFLCCCTSVLPSFCLKGTLHTRSPKILNRYMYYAASSRSTLFLIQQLVPKQTIPIARSSFQFICKH